MPGFNPDRLIRMQDCAPPARYAQLRPASFPIVGFGASSGDPDARTMLGCAVPVDSGMAYVIVQNPVEADGDDMPQSAIASVIVDALLTTVSMPIASCRIPRVWL